MKQLVLKMILRRKHFFKIWFVVFLKKQILIQLDKLKFVMY